LCAGSTVNCVVNSTHIVEKTSMYAGSTVNFVANSIYIVKK